MSLVLLGEGTPLLSAVGLTFFFRLAGGELMIVLFPSAALGFSKTGARLCYSSVRLLCRDYCYFC